MKTTNIINTIGVYQVIRSIVLILIFFVIPGSLNLIGNELGKIFSNPIEYKKLIIGSIVIAIAEICITYPFFYGVTNVGLYIFIFTTTISYLILNTLASVYYLGEQINNQIIFGIILALISIGIIIHGNSKMKANSS